MSNARAKVIPTPKDGWREAWGKCPRTGKRSYPTRHAAIVAARRNPCGASVYRCPHCDEHHLTHYTARVQKAIRLVLSIRGNA